MSTRCSIEKEMLMDTVCADCPGSLWGEKSICRIHNKSIGDITSCRQWENYLASEYKDHNGQMAFFDLEPAIEIVQKVDEDLKNYHWMVKEIQRLKDDLHQALKVNDGGSNLVAQYGIEASLPKAKNKPNSTLIISEERYERQIHRLRLLEEKVHKIDEASQNITDEKERAVLESILDGVRMNMIASHVGISRQRLNEIKREILKKMAWVLYESEVKG